MPPKSTTTQHPGSDAVPQVSCSHTDCSFETPPNVPSWDIALGFLTQHTVAVHPPPAGQIQQGTPGHTQQAPKLEKLPRPTFELPMSEGQWDFLTHQWRAYIGQSPSVTEEQHLNQLRAACSPALLQRMFDMGNYSTLTNPAMFMENMEKIAVVKVHKAIHTMNMWKMVQHSDETIRAFAARITGTADLCGMTVTCSCGAENSFRDKVVMQVLLHGMRENDIRSKVLSRNTTGELLELNQAVDYIEAEEAGLTEASNLHDHSTIHAIRSGYKQEKEFEKRTKCRYCGGPRHGQHNTLAERQSKCRAYGKTCAKCGKPNHFSSVCRSSTKPQEKEDTDKNAGHVASFTAGFFPILSTTPTSSHQASSPQKPGTRPTSSRTPATTGSWSFPHSTSLRTRQATPLPLTNRFAALQTDEDESTGRSAVLEADAGESTGISHTKNRGCPPPSSLPVPSPITPPATLAQDYETSTLIPNRFEDLQIILASLQSKSHTGPINTIPLPHHVHDIIAGWHATRPAKSPSLPLQICLDRKAYSDLSVPVPRMHHNRSKPGRCDNKLCVMDTGAQLTVVPTSLLHHLGIKQESIFPVMTRVDGASSPITIQGGILLTFSGTNHKTDLSFTTRQLAYVSSSVDQIYLSRSACADLGTIPSSFPELGSCTTSRTDSKSAIAAAVSPHSKCSNSGVVGSDETPCSCPARTPPPTSPPSLPCEPTEGNLLQLKEYILKRYASSAFNCCTRQPLPLMKESPPLRLYVSEDAKPVAVHQPAQVPAHWVQDVKAGLDRDERLGVIERVPVNEPTRWCSRMIITAKHDGSPRRVVDFQTVNDHAPRQTHHQEPPWSLVSTIPGNTVKSVLDCWHGYHSVPIHPADRHLTTFITPWGRYKYRTSPQGFISAGDGYSQRLADIIGDFPDYKRCIDDTLIWDKDIRDNFFRVCKFLDRCSAGGCVFNPDKFQFGSQEVDFLGFRVTNTGTKPCQSFIDNIMSFPSPKNITDVRSWFGLINQISYSFAAAPVMSPFRHLLATSSKIPFMWTEDLETAFQASKTEIIQQCEKGVRSFTPHRPTALATDWSRTGVGFWLCQKFCDCEGGPQPKPGCCPQGWQTIYCGSRFCTPAESKYHPIEGEAMAAAYGLEKCKFFVLGLPDLILCLDHAPLLATFGSQDLADIPNPRLLNFKIKSLRFRFKVCHIPGKKHVTADTLSRRSDHPPPPTPKPDQHLSITSNVSDLYAESLGPPDWVSGPAAIATLLMLEVGPDHDSVQLEALIQGYGMASLAALYTDGFSSINSNKCTMCPLSHSDMAIISWDRLEAACLSSPVYRTLHHTVSAGAPDAIEEWDDKIKPFHQHRQSLVVAGPVVLLHDRPVIPQPLRQEVLEHLHSGHAGVSTMFARASSTLYWPGYRADITRYRATCRTCDRVAPSNPSEPPTFPDQPAYPFHSVCADFFTINNKNYLAVTDRYSNWLSIFQLQKDDSENVIKTLREYSTQFGIPAILSTDGAFVFTSKAMDDFCRRWGIHHRVSSAYRARSNKRAEVGVKQSKRLILDNLLPDGSIDNDKFARALLTYRNNPCPTTGLSHVHS